MMPYDDTLTDPVAEFDNADGGHVHRITPLRIWGKDDIYSTRELKRLASVDPHDIRVKAKV